MDRPLPHRRARAAQGRPQEIQATKALPAVARPPVGAGGRMAGPRLVAAARQRQAARPVAGRCAHARVPGDHLPMGLLQQAASGTLGAVPAARAQAAPQARRQEDVALPDSRTGSHLRASAGGRRPQRFRPLGGRQRDRRRMQPAHRGREEDQVPHGRDRARQDRRGKRRGAAGDVLAAAGRRARRRHARQRHRVRPPRKAARRAGHGHVLRRPVLQLAAGKQRERERHDPPVSARTQRDPDGHGRGTAGDCVDEADNRPMRVLGYRTPAEAFADELLELQDQQGCCTSK